VIDFLKCNTKLLTGINLKIVKHEHINGIIILSDIMCYIIFNSNIHYYKSIHFIRTI